MQTENPRGPALRSPRTAATLVLLALAVLLLGATRAQAESVTWTHAPTGAKITLDPATVAPGGRVQISGTGFTRATGSGLPWIAIKPDDQDLLWAYGGPDRITGEPGEAPIWFQPRPDGTFSGWIDVPAGTSTTGPASGANAGKHWFRILGGVFSSDGASPTPVITYEAFFTVADRIQTGSLGPTGIYKAGRHVSQGGVLTLRGSGLPVSTSVAVALDGTALDSGVPTDAAGAIVPAATSAVTIPAGTTPGPHQLTFTVGGGTITQTIVVHPAPSALVRTATVRPGGLVDVAVSNFVGVAGTGQKVGVLIGQGQAAPTVACIETDATGAGRATVRVPDGQTGTQPIRFPAGSKCQTPADPGFAADDLPARPATGSLAQTLSIDAAAPAATVAAPAVRGRSARVTGEGFPAGTVLTPEIDGAAAGAAITVGADGRFAVDLPLAPGLGLGRHVLVLAGPGGVGAATAFEALDPAIAPVPTPVVPAPASPGAPVAPPVVPVAPTAPAALPAATIKSLRVRGTRVRLDVGRILGRRTTVSVRSRAKIRVSARSRARIITFASTTTTKPGVLSIRLTRDGRAALRRLRKVTVVVRLAPRGGAVVTRRLVLRA